MTTSSAPHAESRHSDQRRLRRRGHAADRYGGANEHTFTPSDGSQLPFLSVEEGIGSSLETYNYLDAVVNTLHLEAEPSGYLSGTAGIIARRQTAGVTRTSDPDWDNGAMMVGTNILVTYNSVTVPAKSFSFDLNNNFADDDYRLGSFYIGDLTRQAARCRRVSPSGRSPVPCGGRRSMARRVRLPPVV